MAIYVYNRQAKKIVSPILKQFGVPVGMSYMSGADLTRDTGRKETPRFIFTVTREVGNQISNAIDKAVADLGFEWPLHAGIEVYFD